MGPYELKQVAGNTWYIQAPVNLGIYVHGESVTLIDSGNDKEAGRQIAKLLESRSWKLSLIVNTHSNADHIGGNAFLQVKTGCRIAATRLESVFIIDPVLEPAFLWGGMPFEHLRNKFLEAKPSDAVTVIPNSGLIPGTDLRAVPLPGHFLDMIGIMTPDGVFFIADSVFSEEIIAKYHVFYIFDVAAYLETLDVLARTEARLFIPSHGSPVEDIAPRADANRRKILEIIDAIGRACETPCTAEEIFMRVCSEYGIGLNHNQYVLVMSALRSYLAYMSDKGLIRSSAEGGRYLWMR